MQHNRTLSRGATRRKLHILSAEKNSLFYDPRISRPQTLSRQDFVVNFATCTRVYTVSCFGLAKTTVLASPKGTKIGEVGQLETWLTSL